MEDGLLNNREVASLIWAAILGAYLFLVPGGRDLRKTLSGLLPTALVAKILVPTIAYVTWLAAGVWVAFRVGIWDFGLLKLTVVWVVFAGLGLLFSFDQALRQDRFFRSALLASATTSVLVEFYVNFQSFPLGIELLFQPVIFIAVVSSLMDNGRSGRHHRSTLSQRVLAVFGVSAIAWVTWNIATRWNEIDITRVAREFFAPLWLTLLALAFVYILALYAGYEMAFKRISWKAGDHRTWRAKAAFVSSAGLWLGRLRERDGSVQMRAAAEPTFWEARRAINRALREKRELLEPNTDPSDGAVDQLVWSITTQVGDVCLKGDLPDGYPTETWLDGELLDRDLGGDFSWDLGSGLPSPVAFAQQIDDCERLAVELDHWRRGAEAALTRDGAVRQAAYHEAVRQWIETLGCR